MGLVCYGVTCYMLMYIHKWLCVLNFVRLCAYTLCTSFAQLSWMTECYCGGSLCTHATPLTPGCHCAPVMINHVLQDWPCPGGRGLIICLITLAWLLLSVVVPGHLSLLLSGKREEES